MTTRALYRPDPKCAHVAIVERTCDYQQPHYLDDEGRVGVIVMIRVHRIECLDCGGALSGLEHIANSAQPLCELPDCDCLTEEEQESVRLRPFWNEPLLPHPMSQQRTA